MRFDRRVIEVGNKKSLCLSLPSVIVRAYSIKRKDIVTLEIYLKGKGIEFTSRVYSSAGALRITIPKPTVRKNLIKPGIHTFEFLKNHREGVK